MKNLFFFTAIFSLSALNAQLSNSLIYKYDLDGNSNDASINQINAITFGANGTTNRNFNANSAMDFDGIDDYIEIPNSPLLKCQFPITISFWTNVNETDEGIFLSSDLNSGMYYGYWVGLTANMQIHVNFGNGGAPGSGTRRTKVSTQTLTPNEWHHVICIIRSYNDMDIFIDCVNAGGTYSGSGSTSIGYSNFGGRLFSTVFLSIPEQYFKGQLDDVRLWSRELSSNEINSFCSPIQFSNNNLENTSSCTEVFLDPPTATDIDGNILTGVSNTTFPISNQGLTTVTWTYTDLDGNTASQNQEVTITADINVSIIQVGNMFSSSIIADSYQWYKCTGGEAIPGETGHDFSPTTESDYFLVVTSGNCVDTSECVKFDFLKINENEITINSFPNPVKDFLTLNIENNSTISYSVYDELGQLVCNNKLEGNKIDFRNISIGIYLLKVFENGVEISNLKVVKN
jgi:hypothetical protein